MALVIGTAGHIDHGKSALVKALTGTDPDRLKEERDRGITIDLGFAHAVIGGRTVAFIDVPGHERFVRNMLAGAGGIDAVLLVVAADESVMPQTREHFEICRLLGVPRGIVALSKSDLVDPDTASLAALEVRDLVAGSFLEGAPVVPVSAATGSGLEALRDAIGALAVAPRESPAGRATRLPIDRVFSVKGFGTVVTGTLVSGHVGEGDELELLPEGRRARVRGLQVHGRQAAEADAPGRVAVNLGGMDREDVARGATLATPDALPVTRRVDARVELLASARGLRQAARVRVYHDTSEHVGRVTIGAIRDPATGSWRAIPVGAPAVVVPPGGAAFVRIRLETPAVLTRRDRFVLRAYAPSVTIGGGIVLDPEPPASGVRRDRSLGRFEQLEIPPNDDGRGDDDLARVVALWLAAAGERGLTAEDLARRSGAGVDAVHGTLVGLTAGGRAVEAGARLFPPEARSAVEARIAGDLAAWHAAAPFEAGIARETLRERTASRAAEPLFEAALDGLRRRGIVVGTDRVALASHRPAGAAADSELRTVIENAARARGLLAADAAAIGGSAAAPGAVLDRVLRGLIKDGILVNLGGLIFHAAVLAGLKQDVVRLARTTQAATRLDVAAFKTRYGVSRKHAIPLLEWLDRERVTRRVGNQRVVIG